MIVKKPFTEAPWSGINPRIADSVTHYLLDNGWTVSVKDCSIINDDPDWWEAWAWRTDDHHAKRTTWPVMCKDEHQALCYRDALAREPDPADSFEKLAQDAITALGAEEGMTESQFGVGNPDENYYELSEALQARFDALSRSRC